MEGKRSAIEADHRLGYELRVSGQLEHRVGNTAANTGEIDIRALTHEISRSAPIAKLTQSTSQPRSTGATCTNRLKSFQLNTVRSSPMVLNGSSADTHPGSFSGSCGDRARRAGHPRCN